MIIFISLTISSSLFNFTILSEKYTADGGAQFLSFYYVLEPESHFSGLWSEHIRTTLFMIKHQDHIVDDQTSGPHCSWSLSKFLNITFSSSFWNKPSIAFISYFHFVLIFASHCPILPFLSAWHRFFISCKQSPQRWRHIPFWSLVPLNNWLYWTMKANIEVIPTARPCVTSWVMWFMIPLPKPLQAQSTSSISLFWTMDLFWIFVSESSDRFSYRQKVVDQLLFFLSRA